VKNGVDKKFIKYMVHLTYRNPNLKTRKTMTVQMDVVGLDKLLELPIEEKKQIPMPVLSELWNAIDSESLRLKEAKEDLQFLMCQIFEDEAEKIYKSKGTAWGQASWGLGGYKVTSKVNKRVVWDQGILKAAYEEIKNKSKEDESLIDVKFNISETNYKNTKPWIKALVQEGRDVMPGAQVYKISKGG